MVQYYPGCPGRQGCPRGRGKVLRAWERNPGRHSEFRWRRLAGLEPEEKPQKRLPVFYLLTGRVQL